MRIGYREDAVPFSFAGTRRAVPRATRSTSATRSSRTSPRRSAPRPLRVEYRRVTPADRIEQVADGRIDLECGATTDTADGAPAGRVLAAHLRRRHAAAREARQPASAPCATCGTPGRRRARHDERGGHAQLRGAPGRAFELRVADDYRAGPRDARRGRGGRGGGRRRPARGLPRRARTCAATTRWWASSCRTSPTASCSPGTTRRSPAAVDAAFRRLAATREIRWIYDRWFLRTLPSGVRLGLPMSPQLRRSFEILGLPPE